jgi:diacylglycerol kinase (ATP)
VKGSHEEHVPLCGEELMPPFSLRKRAKSFSHALAGGRVLLSTQHNAWIHAGATLLVLIIALVLNLSRLEWALLFVVIGLVWAMEALNTAVELLADVVSPEWRQAIGAVKDVAAFGVLVAACTAILIGLLVFLPRVLVT